MVVAVVVLVLFDLDHERRIARGRQRRQGRLLRIMDVVGIALAVGHRHVCGERLLVLWRCLYCLFTLARKSDNWVVRATGDGSWLDWESGFFAAVVAVVVDEGS